MSLTITHRRFVFPFLLLVALAGLFIVHEIRSEEAMRTLHRIVDDNTPDLFDDLQMTSWDLHEKAVRISGAVPFREQEKDLTDDVARLTKQAGLLKERLSEGSGQEVHGEPVGKMTQPLFDSIEGIGLSLMKARSLAPEGLKQFKENVERLNQQICQTNHMFRTMRQQAIQAASAHIEQARIQRYILILLMLPCGLFMAVFLFANARRHRANIEQIEMAEHYSALFAEILQSTRIGVKVRSIRSPDQPVVFVNRAFAAMTGYDLIQLCNQKPDLFFGWHTDKKTIAALNEAMACGESKTVDLLIYRKDGSSFWGEWHVSPIRDGHGRITHSVCLLTDMTDMKQAQEALMLAKEEAERASAIKGSFLATMSHEIRTPLNGLLGVLQLLKDSRLDEDQTKLLQVALNSGYALHEIINDILDFTRIDAGKVTLANDPFSLRELLRHCRELTAPVASSKNLELQLEINESLPDRLLGDAGRIRQILLNLVTNAIKYTEKGSVTIRVSHLLSQTSVDKSTALLRFEVIDTGIGISASDQDRLFEEFSRVENSYTRRFSGTGLGLAISKRIVALMHGEIGIESRPGQGSKFWFMLPLVIDPQRNVIGEKNMTEKDMPYPPTPNLHRVLLVEDSPTNRLVTGRFLEKAGYAFDEAVSGAAAIEAARTRSYDLVLMDVSMPGMDGLEATQRIRELGGWASRVPVIALTAHVMEGDRERCLAAGMNDHLPKPVDYDDLTRVLRIWVEAPVSDPYARTSYEDAAALSSPALPLPVVDMAVLRRLVEILGVDAMMRITQVFLDDLSPRLEELKPNGTALAIDRIVHTAHTLKSSSANCGLKRFSGLMAELERAAARKDQGLVQQLLSEVEAASLMAREKLEQARHQFGAS